MKLSHLKIFDYVSMPWKNGCGMTLQLAISPEGAKFPQDSFLWRLSAASVLEDGRFSLFPGCDRWLAVWEGKGIIMEELGGECTRLRNGEATRFPGDEPVEAKLLSGPIRDFGLIFQRGSIEATLEVLKLGTSPVEVELDGTTHFWFCASGRVHLQAKSEAMELAREETCRLDTDPSERALKAFVLLEAQEPGTVVFAVKLG